LTGEPNYANGLVNDPTISPVNAAKATTLVQVEGIASAAARPMSGAEKN